MRRRVHAVERVSFDLHPGETLALVGESGCGKSTTGRSLLRLVESESGLIEFDGGNIRDLPPGRSAACGATSSSSSRIPTPPSIPPDRGLLDHGAAAGPRDRDERREAEARVAWLLERVGLTPDQAQRYPHEFSGGSGSASPSPGPSP